MKIRFIAAAVLALFLLVPAAPARADVVLTPYVGSLFGGDLSGNRAAYGATAAFMGGGIFGGGDSDSTTRRNSCRPAWRTKTSRR